MSDKKPRGKTPSLICVSNGRPEKVSVERKSSCQRCGCDIHVGQECFGIPKLSGGFTSLKRFCRICFQNILDQTQKDLNAARDLIIDVMASE